jgi:hypothetical protein
MTNPVQRRSPPARGRDEAVSAGAGCARSRRTAALCRWRPDHLSPPSGDQRVAGPKERETSAPPTRGGQRLAPAWEGRGAGAPLPRSAKDRRRNGTANPAAAVALAPLPLPVRQSLVWRSEQVAARPPAMRPLATESPPDPWITVSLGWPVGRVKRANRVQLCVRCSADSGRWALGEDGFHHRNGGPRGERESMDPPDGI